MIYRLTCNGKPFGVDFHNEHVAQAVLEALASVAPAGTYGLQSFPVAKALP
jgi:hypothetical protein